MSILVTGGTGYLGAHTCVKLLEAGRDVVIIDNLVNSKANVLDSLEQITGKRPLFYYGDLRDGALLEQIFGKHEIEAVIHFAGLKAVGESVQKPLEYYDNNLGGTMALLECMQKHGCKRIVFSSSATVYGMHNAVPFREDMPTSATNPYGQTKVMIEQMLRDLFTADAGWGISILRYFNPLGAHESALIGEDPNGIPNNLLPYVVGVAAGKYPCLNIFGDDYDTPDGTGVRDYIHVDDLAAGHILALEALEQGPRLDIINLGTGKGYSVKEVAGAFERATGVHIPCKIQPRRPGDIATCYADIAHAREYLGFEAKKDLEQMCASAWAFAKRKLMQK
ncbi:MAG: UDP-glucose 4-epimerase GalE [Clostridiales bacterium]|nr:UDP-glucose 4-epimerase GalE [Clostridiales bacterium]